MYLVVFLEDKEKTVVVKYETWLRIQRLRRFPERGSMDAVISEALDELEKNQETKEVL